MNLGSQLREARLAAGLTITEVAERAGFSASYISQVERDLANPSIGAVNRIAAAIGIRMSAFFTNGSDPESHAPPAAREELPTRIVRHNRRKGLAYPGSRVLFELLSPDLQHNLEILHSVAPAGTESGDESISHPGEECAIVLKGQLELTVGGEVHLLEAGDAVTFDSAKPHSWKSLGPEDLEAIWVVTPPHF